MRHRRQHERDDRRAAMAAWVLANVNRDSTKKSEPFSLDEVVAWLGYARPRARHVQAQTAPATTEELKEKLNVVAMLHKGFYGENGPPAQQEESQ